MDVDEGETPLRLRDFDIEVDFSDLEEEERENGNPEHGQGIEERIANIAAEIEKMAPNLKSRQKYALFPMSCEKWLVSDCAILLQVK